MRPTRSRLGPRPREGTTDEAMAITGASSNAHHHRHEVGRVMADMDSGSVFLSDLAEKIARDSGRSVLIILGDGEGSLVGACIAEPDLGPFAAQLRLIADDLAERAAAQLN